MRKLVALGDKLRLRQPRLLDVVDEPPAILKGRVGFTLGRVAKPDARFVGLKAAVKLGVVFALDDPQGGERVVFTVADQGARGRAQDRPLFLEAVLRGVWLVLEAGVQVVECHQGHPASKS